MNVDRQRFCDFIDALSDAQELRERMRNGEEINDTQFIHVDARLYEALRRYQMIPG